MGHKTATAPIAYLASFIIFNLCALLARAQTPVPSALEILTPQAVATIQKTPKPEKLDPFALQIEFAESALKMSDNLTTQSKVIALYERALSAACPGRKERCATIVERLLELDAGNVPAICQKFSLLSAECGAVMAAQENGWYEVDAARWRSLSGQDGGALESSDLAQAIEIKRMKPQVDKLTNEREAILKIPKRETAQEQQLDKVLQEGIALTCGAPKIVFLARNPAGETFGFGGLSGIGAAPIDAQTQANNNGASAAPPSATRTTTSPLDSVLAGFNALPTATPLATATAKPVSRISVPLEERLRRIRILSRECYDFVRVALSLRPAMLQARCAYEGWYAPSCRGAVIIAPANSKEMIDSF